MPSLTLLGQSLLSGLFIGGLYGLLGLGLGLSWGLLRLINLAHFALVFLGAYLTYHLAGTGGMNPFLTVLLIAPAFFVLGVALQWAFDAFRVNELASLLVTFGLTVVIESVIQWVWTADFRRLESPYATMSFRLGPLFVPVTELCMLLAAAALSFLTWAWLRFTWVGKGMRASVEDPDIAAAFGVSPRRLALLLSGVGAAYAGVAGTFVALVYTLAPSQIYAWIGVVFAVVILGGLGNPLGPLVAGIGIGLSESVTMAVAEPSWAPLVSFALLILVLVLRPDRL
ncbi:MAG: branched-chain amino acid ABC transporter permease [Candidatus Rokubacteria bacterium]|nr:branched-chain amino acid ABC transporter permease [Candidatus Rokubacteria bacterium]MBI2525353.1 branched-chain amino acid ABC transporter permease [Candidatus Rokubacteria bacterium]MBI3105390.1 branched-chain amino acid ABC transporter permease [Candidatus Rokubacteria bacterium]